MARGNMRKKFGEIVAMFVRVDRQTVILITIFWDEVIS